MPHAAPLICKAGEVSDFWTGAEEHERNNTGKAHFLLRG